MYELVTVVFTRSRITHNRDIKFRILFMSGSNSYKLGSKEYKHASKTMVLLLLKNESQSSSTGSR